MTVNKPHHNIKIAGQSMTARQNGRYIRKMPHPGGLADWRTSILVDWHPGGLAPQILVGFFFKGPQKKKKIAAKTKLLT
jgi:hypothetical protein